MDSSSPISLRWLVNSTLPVTAELTAHSPFFIWVLIWAPSFLHLFVVAWIINGAFGCLHRYADWIGFICIATEKIFGIRRGKEIGLPVKALDIKNILLIIGSIGLVFFMLNFQTLFKTDIDIIGYVIYSAMIIMPLIILTDKKPYQRRKRPDYCSFHFSFFHNFLLGCI
jgi:hypothetical protein